METTRNTAATTGTQYEETRRTVIDAEAAAAYEDAKAYRDEVLNDLVQRAIDKATDKQYRRIIGSMSGWLICLSSLAEKPMKALPRTSTLLCPISAKQCMNRR